MPNFEQNKENTLYTPFTRKFLGYFQYPYRVRGRKDPDYLNDPNQPHLLQKPK